MKASNSPGPKEIEIIHEHGETFFMKCFKLSDQAYEAKKAIIISNLEDISVEKLSSYFCVLGNET